MSTNERSDRPPSAIIRPAASTPRDPIRTTIPQRKIMLPHHRLLAYHVANDFLDAVLATKIGDTTLRDHARRSAKSTALNVAEGAGRASRADKARAFTHARAECGEAAAAVEIAARSGDASDDDVERVIVIADRLIAMLTGLMR